MLFLFTGTAKSKRYHNYKMSVEDGDTGTFIPVATVSDLKDGMQKQIRVEGYDLLLARI